MSFRICHIIGAASISTLVACGAAQGPHVRVATASAADMRAHAADEVVWYEFQKGDKVPLHFGLIGMAQVDGANVPLELVATRPFFLVVFRNGETKFSYDGKRLVDEPFARWAFVVAPGPERAETGLLLYVGPHDEVPPELRK